MKPTKLFASLTPLAFVAVCLLAACSEPPVEYDVILRNGTIYDGSGKPPIVGDVAIRGQRIAAVGTLPAGARGKTEN